MFTTNAGPTMGLPEDLKDYKAPLGAFQLIEPDQAIFFLVWACFASGFFWNAW